MRKILEQPFAEADTKDIPCILDTDTPLKVKNILDVEWNYVARKIENGISLYTMAYNKINMDSGNGMFQMLNELR